MKYLVFAAGLAVTAGMAFATSPDEWAKLHANASAACIKAAELNEAKVRGAPVDFESVQLLIVDGRYPQPQLKNARGAVYCLYAKKSGKAETAEAPVSAP